MLKYIHEDLYCFSADLEDNDILLISYLPSDCYLSSSDGLFHGLFS